MSEIKFTGGARIGMANATWPFARLKVTKDRLDLNATIIGNLVFGPADITSIEPCPGGIKINHLVPEYKDKVIFWTSKDPNEVIRQIQQTGFFDNTSRTTTQANSEFIKARQKQGGFPVKVPFAIGVVVIWNILFLTDFINYNSEGIPLGNGAIGALGIVFLSSLLTLVSKDFRKIVLKEGRELKDISRFLFFLMFISGMMMISILTFPK